MNIEVPEGGTRSWNWEYGGIMASNIATDATTESVDDVDDA